MARSLTVHRAERRKQAQARLGGQVVGIVFLWTSGIHLGIVAADPGLYQHFADSSFLPFVRDGWRDVVMAAPAAWGLALAGGEAALGALLLAGGRAAKVGWIGVLTFHVLLMLFGFGFWLWSVPALCLLVPLARRDWPVLTAGPVPHASADRARSEREARARALREAYERHPASGTSAPARSSTSSSTRTAHATHPRSTPPRRSPHLTLVPPPRQHDHH